ncbi:MAG TPA: biopolymer transporter ExbD [Rhizomicrobium sp.]|jgi:biopolymer transport protein ExbD|nr:biopolymer transporter ExbD [Rhizomicrobium sp.]
MAMNVGKAEGDQDVFLDINTTPLIDVMLVLLTMLIITLPIQTHAVKLDMPVGPPPKQIIQPTVDNIMVDFDGTIYWNNAPVNMGTLDSYFYNIGQKPIEEQDEIHITANRLAKYDAVAKVMANAQRRGAVKIGIVNTNTYIQ